jgi:hypothetical protein
MGEFPSSDRVRINYKKNADRKLRCYSLQKLGSNIQIETKVVSGARHRGIYLVQECSWPRRGWANCCLNKRTRRE